MEAERRRRRRCGYGSEFRLWLTAAWHNLVVAFSPLVEHRSKHRARTPSIKLRRFNFVSLACKCLPLPPTKWLLLPRYG